MPFVARLGEWQRRIPLLQILALVVLYGYGLATIDGFGSQRVLYAILINASLLGLAGAGQTIVVLVGGIDFSIAAFISAGNVIIAELCGTEHWSLGAAVAVALAVGVAGGFVNGLVSYRFKVEPLIVTLGVSALLSGLILKWINGAATGVAPAWLGKLTAANGTTLGVTIPPVIVIWAVVALAIGLVLTRTRAGRSLYLTGVNQRARGSPSSASAAPGSARTWPAPCSPPASVSSWPATPARATSPSATRTCSSRWPPSSSAAPCSAGAATTGVPSSAPSCCPSSPCC